MTRHSETDFSLSLDQLQCVDSGNPDDAPTPLVRDVLVSRKKPVGHLSNEEIGQLIVQMDGFPYILDVVMPKLHSNPLMDGGYYPGDVLSCLIRAGPEIWHERPNYREMLPDLYQRAMSRSWEERDAFADSLGMSEDSKLN